jgi:hypothetical protein
MFNKNSQHLIFVCVASILVVLAFWNAAVPVDLQATSRFVADRPEGKLILEAFDPLRKRDTTELKQNHYDPSKLKVSPEELHALEVQVETYIDEKKLTFVQFTGYHSKKVGDQTESDVTGWFKSEAQSDLYVKLDAKFSGVEDKLSLVDVHETPVSGKLNFSSPVNILTISQIWNLSLIKLTAIFLALFCLCLSGIAFTLCILNWSNDENKLWAIPVLFGVVPIKVQLWGSAISWKIATVIFPAGWLANSPLAFGFNLTYNGQTPTEVGGQIALFSFPIAVFYFLRRSDRDFGNKIYSEADNTVGDGR